MGFSPKEPTIQDGLDWQIVRASRTPGPGEYVIPSTCTNTTGGRFGTAISKTGIEMLLYEKSGIPGPGAYSVPRDISDGYQYSMGRRTGPANMPAPYSQFSSDGAGYRGTPSGDHESVKCPWKDSEAWAKVAGKSGGHKAVRPQPAMETTRAISPISAPASPELNESAQSTPNKIANRDYEEQGRAPSCLQVRSQLGFAICNGSWYASYYAVISTDYSHFFGPRQDAAPAVKKASVTAPWRDAEAWAKVSKRPVSAAGTRQMPMVTAAAAWSRPASASSHSHMALRKPRIQRSADHGKVVAPWRDSTAWRTVAKEPSRSAERATAMLASAQWQDEGYAVDLAAIETPWRVKSWSKGRPSKQTSAGDLLGQDEVNGTGQGSTTAASSPLRGQHSRRRGMPRRACGSALLTPMVSALDAALVSGQIPNARITPLCYRQKVAGY